MLVCVTLRLSTRSTLVVSSSRVLLARGVRKIKKLIVEQPIRQRLIYNQMPRPTLFATMRLTVGPVAMSDPQTTTTTRPSLLLRLRDPGDTGAWHDFVELYGGMIFQYCRRREMQAADASEITQEVLLQVSRSIGSFEYQPHRGKFRSWLSAIVRTKLIAHVRATRGKVSSFPLSDSHDSQGTVDGVWIDVWQEQLVATALRSVALHMTPENFDAFRAAWVEGHSAQQVANELGLPTAQVYVAKSRGLSLLREKLLELADEIPITNPVGMERQDDEA